MARELGIYSGHQNNQPPMINQNNIKKKKSLLIKSRRREKLIKLHSKKQTQSIKHVCRFFQLKSNPIDNENRVTVCWVTVIAIIRSPQQKVKRKGQKKKLQEIDETEKVPFVRVGNSELPRDEKITPEFPSR